MVGTCDSAARVFEYYAFVSPTNFPSELLGWVTVKSVVV